MPESQAIIDGEFGKRVTITIAEISASDPVPSEDEPDPNTFVISNDKYRLTITIAE